MYGNDRVTKLSVASGRASQLLVPVEGMLSMLRDICENSVIHVVLTFISPLIRQYMMTTNRSCFRMISSGMFTVHVW